MTVICNFVLFSVLLNNHHFGAPALFNTSMLLMMLFGTNLTHVCDCVRYLWFTFFSESNKLISALCGVAFGSLLCAYSLVDVSSIL